MPSIIVNSAGTACPVTPAPDTPETERRIAEEWQRQAAVSLARILQNPVPKGKINE
jgi:NAD(P)-dependent dehydrogenase (short-subunit alcohol dehydrogenase family)